MDRFTLVPRAFFNASEPSQLLSGLVHLEKDDNVKYTELPEYEAVLVYCNELPAIYRMIGGLACIKDSEKVMMQYDGSSLSLVLARGSCLLLANSFEAPGFTTALYFIVASLKQFGIRPEETALRYSGDMEYDWQELLYKYFKAVVRVA